MGLLLIEVDMESDYDSISTVLDSRENNNTDTDISRSRPWRWFFLLTFAMCTLKALVWNHVLRVRDGLSVR